MAPGGPPEGQCKEEQEDVCRTTLSTPSVPSWVAAPDGRVKGIVVAFANDVQQVKAQDKRVSLSGFTSSSGALPPCGPPQLIPLFGLDPATVVLRSGA